MNTSTFLGDNKFDEGCALHRAIGFMDTYDPCNFIDAMQAVRFKNTFRSRYGLPMENDEAFWSEVILSLQSRDSKAEA